MTPEEALEIARRTWPLMSWSVDPNTGISADPHDTVVLGADAGVLVVTISLDSPPMIIGTLHDRNFFLERTNDVRGALIALERQFRQLVDVPPLAEDAQAEAVRKGL